MQYRAHIFHFLLTYFMQRALAVRFFESSRIRWLMSVGHDIGGPTRAEALLRPQGIAFILKSMEVKYRRPVCFPDTVSVNPSPFLQELYS